MIRLSGIIFLAFTVAVGPANASLADAQRIQKAYQTTVDRWTAEMKAAPTPSQQTKIWEKRPVVTPYAKEMWASMSQSLQEPWILEPAVWFLKVTPGLTGPDANGSPAPLFSKENDALRKAIEAHHLKSPALIPVCVALASAPNSGSLVLLEKIQGAHPDPKIQGVAALGAAIQLKSIGDSGELMSKRLTYIRKSIIQSADVAIDGTTVAKLAEDELYIIRFLTKGRTAPDLIGTDAAGKPLSLAANQGKVIVLLFWNSNVPDADRVVEITSSLEQKFKDRPLTVLGVNNDSLEKLRALQADGTVSWRNFSDPNDLLAKQYRVGSWPVVYVLDGDRKIHYAGAPGSFAELTAEALVAEIKPTVPVEN